MSIYQQIKEKIIQTVIGQDKAVDECLLFFLKILLNRSLDVTEKNNDILLLTGATGTGKTFLVQTLAKNFNTQLIEINSKAITQEGWAGTSLKTYLKDWAATELDLTKLPQLIIIYLDEFDKACIPLGASNTDNYAEHVQNSLLKCLEYDFKTIPKFQDIPVNRICFILSGNFEGLRKNRLIKHIGFNEKEEERKEAIYKELIDFGLIPEIAGRISKVIELDFLNKEQYLKMWESEHFLVQKWDKALESAGINSEFELKRNECIEKAVKKKLGVRGLIQEFNELLNELLLIHADMLLLNLQLFNEINKGYTQEIEMTIEELMWELTDAYKPSDKCWMKTKERVIRFDPPTKRDKDENLMPKM